MIDRSMFLGDVDKFDHSDSPQKNNSKRCSKDRTPRLAAFAIAAHAIEAKKMKLIKDGNFVSWFRALIWISGLAMAILSYYFLEGKFMFWGVIIGTVIASIGAYAENANALKLKPFDTSYQKARESYDRNKSSEEK